MPATTAVVKHKAASVATVTDRDWIAACPDRYDSVPLVPSTRPGGPLDRCAELQLALTADQSLRHPQPGRFKNPAG